MKQIRRNVFETNSSSVHSLVYSQNGLEPSGLKIDKSGDIFVALGKFDNSYCVYKDQYSKLSYLLTCIYYLAGCDVDKIYNRSEFEEVQKTVCNYTGAKSIKIENSEGYIDHQSVPEWGITIINAYSEDEVINFIFNRNIWLKTDCD